MAGPAAIDKETVAPATPQAMVLPVSPQAPSPPRPGLEGATRYAELGAKVAVAASLLAYGFGFLVAVQHYSRLSVPIRYVDHVTFLAAGILFLATNGTAYVIGRVLGVILWPVFVQTTGYAQGSLSWRQLRNWRRPPILSPVGAIFMTVAMGGSLLIAPFGMHSHLVMTFATSVTLGLFPLHTNWPQAFLSRLYRTAFIAAQVLYTIVSFSTEAFPYAAAHFGGGRPQLLARVTVPISPALAEHDAWMNVGCRPDADPSRKTPFCRMFFRVHEATEFLFLAITDVDGDCGHQRPGDLIEAALHATCFQRLSNSSIPRLESLAP